MNRDDRIRRDPHRTAQAPLLKDFYHDMNKHRTASYTRIGDRYVLEADTCPGGGWLTVWEAVRSGGAYVVGEHEGNRYEWDAIGRKQFDSVTDARAAAEELMTVHKVREWCQSHPYTGPRSSWEERANNE